MLVMVLPSSMDITRSPTLGSTSIFLWHPQAMWWWPPRPVLRGRVPYFQTNHSSSSYQNSCFSGQDMIHLNPISAFWSNKQTASKLLWLSPESVKGWHSMSPGVLALELLLWVSLFITKSLQESLWLSPGFPRCSKLWWKYKQQQELTLEVLERERNDSIKQGWLQGRTYSHKELQIFWGTVYTTWSRFS